MDDQVLLSQYVATQDAKAFKELTHRYSGLVKGVCVRLLGNSHDAEEVTQECFFELSRHAAEVHTSLGGWLHKTATSRSLNALRSRARRKVRERVFGLEAQTITPAVDLTGPDLKRLIQGALQELPDDLRLPMVLHYVDGRSQRDVAIHLGVNQSTISRRMRDALRQLREKLSQAGYAATAPAMMVLMQEHAAAATSEAGLTQIASSGTAAKAAATTSFLSSLKLAAMALLPMIAFLIFDGWASLLLALCVILSVARYRPLWASDVMSRLGLPDLYHQSTFALARWDWTTPPQNWRRQVRNAFVGSVLTFALSLTFALGTNHPQRGTVVMGLLFSMGFFGHAMRLWHRAVKNAVPLSVSTGPAIFISAFPSIERLESVQSVTSRNSMSDWFEAAQLTSIGIAGVGITVPLLIQPQSGVIWPAVVLCGAIGGAMLIAGVRLYYRLLMSRPILSFDTECSDQESGTSRGLLIVVGIGAAIVALLSGWVFWNPGTVRSLSLALAALQTSMLGWIIYRIAAFRNPAAGHVVRRLAIIVLVGCFVMNSGVCLAHWLR